MESQKDKILIVDDDNRNIFALSMVLRARGFNCVSASGALEGIKMMSEDHTIAIVLMDMMMPEMDGYQALAKMKYDKRLSTIPVIAVTAQAMSGDKEKCLNAGAAAYISKPVNVDLLLELIKKYIG